MMGYNYFFLIGKVTDIFTKYSSGDIKITLLVNETTGEKIPVGVQNPLSDIVRDHVREGQTISVKGRVIPSEKRSVDYAFLIAEHIMMMESATTHEKTDKEKEEE